MRAFTEVLKNKKPERIAAAFQEWMQTKSIMPTPADILTIVDYDFGVKKTWQPEFPEDPYIDPAGRTEIAKENVSRYVQTCRKNLVGDGVKKLDVGEPNYAHWNRLTPEQKELCKIRKPIRQ